MKCPRCGNFTHACECQPDQSPVAVLERCHALLLRLHGPRCIAPDIEGNCEQMALMRDITACVAGLRLKSGKTVCIACKAEYDSPPSKTGRCPNCDCFTLEAIAGHAGADAWGST